MPPSAEAVESILIVEDEEPVPPLLDAGVCAGHEGLVHHDVAGLVTADHGDGAVQRELHP